MPENAVPYTDYTANETDRKPGIYIAGTESDEGDAPTSHPSPVDTSRKDSKTGMNTFGPGGEMEASAARPPIGMIDRHNSKSY